MPRPSGPAASAIASLFADHGVERGATLIDVGCGTGDYTIELDRAGFEAVGVDISPELIQQARLKAAEAESGARFQVGDLRSWRPTHSCEGVLCRGVLNDLISEGDRQAALEAMRRVLRQGGILVLDVRDWDASAARYASAPVVEREARTPGGTLTFRSDTTLRPADHVLLVHERIAMGDGSAEEFDFEMRCWSPEELRQRTRDAGFDQIELLRGASRAGARADRIVAVVR